MQFPGQILLITVRRSDGPHASGTLEIAAKAKLVHCLTPRIEDRQAH